MKIVIAHLYYDLLNLYGESGNVKALKKYFENQNIDVVIKNITVNEEMDLKDVDCIYIGMGTENNQKIALKHLLQYKNDIKDYLDKGGFLIATGNSLELFGKYIIDRTNEKHKALSLFKYYAVEKESRIICESVLNCEFIDKPIIGFQNRGSVLEDNKNTWLDVIKGYGYNLDSNREGINKGNFYGTYLVGPLLARNPLLLEYIGNCIIKQKDETFDFGEVNFEFENSAYQINLEKYMNK